MLKKNDSKKRFSIFGYGKNGIGVKKEELHLPYTFANFFRYFKRHFSKLLSVNIAMILGNFPIFFALPALAGYFNRHSIAPADINYPVIAGMLPFLDDTSPLLPLLGAKGVFTEISVWTPLSTVFMLIAALVIFTFGPVNAGSTYIIRNMLKGEPVSVWDDFRYAIRRNIKQGLLFGILDVAMLYMFVVVDLRYYLPALGSGFIPSMMFYISIASCVFYLFMRFYIYLMMVTFDLSLWKLIKNAMIFAFLGIKRNLVAGFFSALILVLDVLIFRFLPPLGIALPLVGMLAVCSYITAYAAWPKIKSIMIDPYMSDETPDETDEEPIMHDES